jgi:hypothetical protein
MVLLVRSSRAVVDFRLDYLNASVAFSLRSSQNATFDLGALGVSRRPLPAAPLWYRAHGEFVPC